MQLKDLILRVRSLTRDFSNSIFREPDIIDYVNEGIARMQQIIPQFSAMKPLVAKDESPILVPEHYHHLLAVYSASRCFYQDERHYQASNLMNEFEQKLEELNMKIESGSIIVTDPTTGEPIVSINATDYVVDNYFMNKNGLVDFDDGVEEIE